MKKITYFLFAFSLLLFLISAGWFFLGHIDEKDIFASVNVSDRVGFDLNKSSLSFGSITPPGEASRDVVFDNNYNFPVLLSISSHGDIKPLLMHERFVRVESGEKKEIGFVARADGDTKQAYYQGRVNFRIIPLRN